MHHILFVLCEFRQWQWGLLVHFMQIICLSVCASQRVCTHLPPVHSALIAIPSGRQESAGLLWASAPSLDSTDHHAAAPREALFLSFITSSLLHYSLASLSFCHRCTVFYAWRYFSTRPRSVVSFKCYLHGVSGFIRSLQTGRKRLERAGRNVQYEKVLD